MSRARVLPSPPMWETASRKPLPGGRVPGSDRSLWAYRAIPSGAVSDVRDPQDCLIPGSRLDAAFRELSALTRLGAARNRSVARRNYRAFHILHLDIPTPFAAAPGSAAPWLNQGLSGVRTRRRLAVIGVPLMASFDHSTLGQTVRSLADFVFEPQASATEFDADFALVDEAFNRCGLPPITAAQYRLANAWWNDGASAATPYIAHDDHMHYFSSLRRAEQITRGDHIGCDGWAQGPGRREATFASVEDLELGTQGIADPAAWWCRDLVDAGARAVSIRGLIEPPRITRQELARQARGVRHNMDEAVSAGKMPRAEHDERLATLGQVEDSYAVSRSDAPPTLLDVRITVAFDGLVDDVAALCPSMVLAPMETTSRQAAAWAETFLCSTVRANPNLHELPSITLAHSGLADLSAAGDSRGKLALLGFTERDSQPVYISASGASDADHFPLLATCSATGSGKTMVLAFLAYQWALLGVPQYVIDPKEGSDLSGLFSTLPDFRVDSMDDMAGHDGGLDPLRIIPEPAAAVELAASILHTVNPWGTADERDKRMTDVAAGLRHGVDNGARAVMTALEAAVSGGFLGDDDVEPVRRFAYAYPAFRTLAGSNVGDASIRAFDGLTYIKAGGSTLQLPSTGSDIAAASPAVRISTSIIRMMIRGSIAALAGRSGVVHVDEAWMAEMAAKDELDAVGRLARQKDVLAAIYTQTPSGPLSSGLGNYTSRFLNGMITDRDEAEAGARFAGIGDPAAVARIHARHGDPDCLAAVVETGQDGRRTVKRGSIFYHTDMDGRFAPVEVVLPPSFLALAGTSPEQVRARLAAAKAAV